MGDTTKIAIVWIALLLWCGLYALTLDQPSIRRLYHPDYIWLTVVIGVSWIIIASAVLERWDVPLSAGLLLLLCVAAGIPIVIWQIIQHSRNSGARNGVQNGDDDVAAAAHARRR